MGSSRGQINHSKRILFKCDGDGALIKLGDIRGILLMVHDGSYMSIVNPTICSMAFLIRCISTGYRATCMIVEKSDYADNYQTEGLGDIGGLLVFRAATRRIFLYKECVAYCDNLGTM